MTQSCMMGSGQHTRTDEAKDLGAAPLTGHSDISSTLMYFNVSHRFGTLHYTTQGVGRRSGGALGAKAPPPQKKI